MLITPALQARAMPSLGQWRSNHSLWTLATTGLLGIAHEVLAVRLLSQVAEDTVYTFALLLAVYLAGSALGAAAFARWAFWRGTSRLLRALAASVLLGMAAMWGAEAIKQAVQPETFAGALATEALLAVAVFGPPTLLMGAPKDIRTDLSALP